MSHLKHYLKGKDAIALAKPIIANMVQELKDHSVGQFQAVFQTISDLAAIIAGNPNQKTKAMIESRGIWDYVINLFGLGDVWSTVQTAGSDLVSTLISELLQIVMKGKNFVCSGITSCINPCATGYFFTLVLPWLGSV